MKNPITILFIFLSIISAEAQDKDFRRFNIEARLGFWSPTDQYFRSSNIHYEILSMNNYYFVQDTGHVKFSGFGSTIMPELDFSLMITKSAGLNFGLSYQHLLNQMATYKYKVFPYKNEAKIFHLKIGFIGNICPENKLSLYYSVGLDFIPYYKISTFNPEYPPIYNSIKTFTIGTYFDVGGKINFNETFSLKTGFDYSYLPSKIMLEGEGNGSVLSVKSNFGGTGFHVGFVINI
ncbi:MAG: hypothetical protein JXR34_07595 [Bacteroidales bacterium]|nr:hypothetical protein [Bacteroidales bacterium]